ncbi:GAD-like domain-containing protein, partial [Xenorhabdus littoralis]|uniref:GAD-like domain-containing protein n=1 Tax=Xenorhabdus littoralis TaxID=2582835 RepID=UPI0029F348A6|nr:GAD-like domain protein [Xenorhabdus sp. psl]
MRDEFFEYFIEKMGEATQHREVPAEAIDKWRGKLPGQLLYYWKHEGCNSYQDGLFSI